MDDALVERKAMIDSLEVGDLVRLNGTLRVVRGIGRSPRRSPLSVDRVYSVTFSILRCSWTRKPYTVRNRCDLYRADFHVVQRGYGAERDPLGIFLQRDICRAQGMKTLLNCCDVIGVVS